METDCLLSRQEVLTRIPISEFMLQSLLKSGRFPKPEKRGNLRLFPDSKITQLIIDLGGKGKGFYRPKQVAKVLGVTTESAVYSRVRRGTCPKGFKLFGNDKITVWPMEDIDALVYYQDDADEKKGVTV